MKTEEMRSKWREDFESMEDIVKYAYDLTFNSLHGAYVSAITQMVYWGYIAARKTAQVEIEELKILIKEMSEKIDNLLTCSNEEYEWQVEQVLKKAKTILGEK